VCGPTPYDYTHVGHARVYVFFDIVRRYFEYLGLEVKLVVNFTDIDDKILNRARSEGRDWREITETYIKDYYEVCEKLHIKPAYKNPRVTEHIQDMVDAIKKLIELGYAYVTPDHSVYFDVTKVPNYGELSHQKIEELIAGARVEPEPYKRNPLDFALWKGRKPGEPWWETPWGPGRPGWHLECVVMATKYLGQVFDIHGGGQDLVFPHHENELAIARVLHGPSSFARYWMHVGLVTIKGEKMSKSLGNIVLVKDVLAKYNPEVFRLYIASTQYRKPLDFAMEHLEQYRTILDTLYTAHDYLKEVIKERGTVTSIDPDRLSDRERDAVVKVNSYVEEFEKYMNNDFNTPKALSTLISLAKYIITTIVTSEEKLSTEVLSYIYSTYLDLCNVFGVLNEVTPPVNYEKLVHELIDLVLEIRSDLRKIKLWELADKIRAKLSELGIAVSDYRLKSYWKWRRNI